MLVNQSEVDAMRGFDCVRVSVFMTVLLLCLFSY